MTTNELTSSRFAYGGRYPFLRQRRAVWREIVRYVAGDIGPVDTLVELGPGYGDFVNQYPARRKLAYDLNPAMRIFFAPDVIFHAENAEMIRLLPEASVDLVFASNFLEHLNGTALDRLLPLIRRALRPGGRLVLIQPNYRRCADRYFEDDTHETIFSDDDIASFLAGHGLDVVKLVPGLLPFSMKSRMPKWPILVRLYLASPLKPLAAQMYVVAERKP